MSKEQENKIEREENWDVPPSDEEYTLEEILAEYGSSRQQSICMQQGAAKEQR